MTSGYQNQATECWTFQSQKRPPSIRLFNTIGVWLNGLNIRRPLVAGEILHQACQRTKLSYWGEDDFITPLELLIEALEREAQLTPFGRAIMRGLLRSFVENRLRIQRYAMDHPAAMEAPLAPALVVIGMPRTGTTLRYNLLAQDPAARPLLGWESLSPAPAPGKRLDLRSIQAGLIAVGIKRAVPELSQIHPFSANAPEECTWLMMNTFRSWAFSLFAYVPSYENWLWRLDESAWASVYEEYRRQLLVLQHQRAGAHWVLKSPVHLMSVGPLLKAVGGARVVLTERSPQESVPSTCSLFATMRALGSDHVDRPALGRNVVERLAEGLRRTQAARCAEPKRIICVKYSNLIADPVAEVRRIYNHFEITLTSKAEASMRQWIRAMQHAPKHRYSLAQFGLDEAIINESFR